MDLGQLEIVFRKVDSQIRSYAERMARRGTHEGSVADVSRRALHEAAKVCSHAMRHAFELEVPLSVGVEAGRTWADLEPMSV